MPSKATESTVSSTSVDFGINTLCHMISQQESFKIDKNAMATILGLSDGKNVPRKIDSIIKPYGWKLESGKMVQIDAAAPTTPVKTNGKAAGDDSKPSSDKKTPGTGKSRKRVIPDEDGKSEEKARSKKPKTPSKAPNPKVEKDAQGDESESEVRDEADRMADEA